MFGHKNEHCSVFFLDLPRRLRACTCCAEVKLMELSKQVKSEAHAHEYVHACRHNMRLLTFLARIAVVKINQFHFTSTKSDGLIDARAERWW